MDGSYTVEAVDQADIMLDIYVNELLLAVDAHKVSERERLATRSGLG
jgi:hypothetical protein